MCVSLIDFGPMIVSIWDDLAVDQCEKVVGLLDPIPIVGLTALKSSTHKGVLSLRSDFFYIRRWWAEWFVSSGSLNLSL